MSKPATPEVKKDPSTEERQKSFRKRVDQNDPPTKDVPLPKDGSASKELKEPVSTGGTPLKSARDFTKQPLNLKALIAQHFQGPPSRMDYNIEEIYEVLDKAKASFMKQPSLLEIRPPMNICGDIHGQFTDLMNIFNSVGLPYKKSYLFLGDYVDRGRHSLEVIMLLMMFKIRYPDNTFLLRGNHELKNINRVYGFRTELRSRFRLEGDTVYVKFNEVFSHMPLAAIVGKKILCMHGGLSPLLKTLDDIRRIQRGKITLEKDSIEQDLLWADPEYGVKGFERNELRGISYYFGADVVKDMCRRLDIDVVIRAHQVVEYGYAFFANRSLVTVFSAARYHPDTPNYGAVAQVGKNLELSFMQLKPKEAKEPCTTTVRKKPIRTMDDEEEDAPKQAKPQ
ncbi:unnamed protein product [Bursaphelenchus xylophilus]|uniref:Serine/threonine-protein phosphatase n=1 Tax=Bursaphelenchus xylophilus TaxID=6326 RepID=A0A1I7S829_BURXY|nr:unnamed protein product [Bursaphelenchus xylophilus]CAG9080649.1 unnamed protein product [Bursaphelenchus xylophilus]